MTAKTIMVQGTSSSAGKSFLVAALCHLFARRGVRVAPFKAQNMSNNAAVCKDGGEIGRAQAAQALAAGLEPTVDMNPVLIKPEADARSQIIVMGRPWNTLEAREYYRKSEALWEVVTGALNRLRAGYDLVIMEGAGSPVELNLKANDFVNMAIAQHARAPVLLVGDIDRGGIFAQLLGTLWLLPPEERALVRGLVVNKFRGDIGLFTGGVRILEEKGSVPVLGVLPYLHGLKLPEEDAVVLEGARPVILRSEGTIDITVIHLPRISNFDDFDPLEAEPGVRVRYVDSAQALGAPDCVILPGTKSTVADLNWLRQRELDAAICQHANQGGAVVGICGGYQMLGEAIHDPARVESEEEITPGLGLLPVTTVFSSEKATYRAEARILAGPPWLNGLVGQIAAGYEIHMGRTEGARPWLAITKRGDKPVHVPDGAMSANGQVWGCYLHGLFGNPSFRRAWLASLGWLSQKDALPDPVADSFTRLADTVESSFDMDLLERIIWDSSF